MRFFILSTFLMFKTFTSFSCTTFVIQNDSNLVFGRNLDWISDDGIVVVNKRNVEKSALILPPSRPMKWNSKYGSLTFNQFGKEFPYGGINEKGLVVEIMLVESDYPKADNRAAVNELQWVQYQLDCSKTVEEVIKSDSFLRISKIQQDLHFLVCDRAGNTAVIEFINNKMMAYRGKNLPIAVLENDRYSKSLDKHENGESCRFSIAARMVGKYDSKEPIIAYSFSILDKVALSGRWSIVYDIKNRKVSFKTTSVEEIQMIDLKKLDFGCNAQALMYDLKTENQGSIDELLVPFDSKINHEKMGAAIRSNRVRLSKSLLTSFYNYHIGCYCSK